MKLTLFCALLATAAATNQCYDGGAKMTKFSYGSGESVTDLLATVPASERAYDKATVKTCPKGQACFKYSVLATADVKIETNSEGVTAFSTVSGNMEFESQGCMDDSTAESTAMSEAICDIWETALAAEFAKDEEMKDIISNIKATCGKPTKCDGDECVLEADRSGATTFGFYAIILSFLYLI